MHSSPLQPRTAALRSRHAPQTAPAGACADHAGAVGRHVRFDRAAHIDDRVGVGRFEDIAVFLDDRSIPVDQLLRRAILLAIVAVEDLDQLTLAVENRRRRIEDQVSETRGIFHVLGATERHEPLIAHDALRHGVGGARHASSHRRVLHHDNGIGDETVAGFDDLVLLRLRLVDIAERCLMDKREMGIVERVFHHA